ncbi:hypothetical protein chiPu_0018324 [Chiloscyllium punctatum]|uniref:Uncharacterized protein n=1 Tax=Chiloscyllium punctatum TaxID=137246 RepID=A0A401RMB4_CHIPU|nr:hypothetical protein [Chiloscyllium punctatum]
MSCDATFGQNNGRMERWGTRHSVGTPRGFQSNAVGRKLGRGGEGGAIVNCPKAASCLNNGRNSDRSPSAKHFSEQASQQFLLFLRYRTPRAAIVQH